MNDMLQEPVFTHGKLGKVSVNRDHMSFFFIYEQYVHLDEILCDYRREVWVVLNFLIGFDEKDVVDEGEELCLAAACDFDVG